MTKGKRQVSDGAACSKDGAIGYSRVLAGLYRDELMASFSLQLEQWSF